MSLQTVLGLYQGGETLVIDARLLREFFVLLVPE